MMVLMKEWLKHNAQVVRWDRKKNRRNFGKNKKRKVRGLFCVLFTAPDYVEVDSCFTIWHLIFFKSTYSALEMAELLLRKQWGGCWCQRTHFPSFCSCSIIIWASRNESKEERREDIWLLGVSLLWLGDCTLQEKKEWIIWFQKIPHPNLILS